tara:strand:+ start:74 stop:775 length:702 start_codon:yes stop_codon:yes gene_type:complete
MKVIAIIPARSGSIRLKNKHRLKLGGKPLINWTINFVSKLKFLDDIILSTDDRYIIKKNKNNKLIKIFIRPKNLIGKNIKTIDVIFDVIKKYEKKFGKIQTVILFQATSPFRSKKKVNLAYKKYINLKMKKSIISVSVSISKNKRDFIISNNKLEVFKKGKFINKKKYQFNGNFYIANKKFLNKHKSFFSIKKTFPLILKSRQLSIDIDTKKDFTLAKTLLYKNSSNKILNYA